MFRLFEYRNSVLVIPVTHTRLNLSKKVYFVVAVTDFDMTMRLPFWFLFLMFPFYVILCVVVVLFISLALLPLLPVSDVSLDVEGEIVCEAEVEEEVLL